MFYIDLPWLVDTAVSQDEVRRMIELGIIKPTTRVCRVADMIWVSAGSINEWADWWPAGLRSNPDLNSGDGEVLFSFQPGTFTKYTLYFFSICSVIATAVGIFSGKSSKEHLVWIGFPSALVLAWMGKMIDLLQRILAKPSGKGA